MNLILHHYWCCSFYLFYVWATVLIGNGRCILKQRTTELYKGSEVIAAKRGPFMIEMHCDCRDATLFCLCDLSDSYVQGKTKLYAEQRF